MTQAVIKLMRFMNKSFILLFILAYHFWAYAQHNPLRDSLKVATEALNYHPDSLDLRLKKASWNVQLGEWDYAKGEYDQVLVREPNNLAALYFRAFVNEQLHRYSFARLDYEHLLYLVPGNFEAQLGLALLNERDNHHTEALDGLNRLVMQFPDSSLAYAARANLERDHQQYDLAAFDYTEAIRRAPDNTDYL